MQVNFKIIILIIGVVLLADDLRNGGIFPQSVYCAVGAGISNTGFSAENMKNNPLGVDVQRAILLSTAVGLMQATGQISEEESQAIMDGRKPFCLKMVSILKYLTAVISNRPMADGWSVFQSR
ncbi:hypothetical protein ACI7BZ_01055 [Xanthobacter sp. AM11]|uniref:hypothetical protein n=1 Tax=Xanthobacter sp. AM11 TaxID=3380643 RepID=UPI0039BFC588